MIDEVDDGLWGGSCLELFFKGIATSFRILTVVLELLGGSMADTSDSTSELFLISCLRVTLHLRERRVVVVGRLPASVC